MKRYTVVLRLRRWDEAFEGQSVMGLEVNVKAAPQVGFMPVYPDMRRSDEGVP